MFKSGDKKIASCASEIRFLYCRRQSKIDRFRIGETRPIARPVHVAVAQRRAVQEADPRFSRLAALELANQKAASHLGIEAGAPKAKPLTNN